MAILPIATLGLILLIASLVAMLSRRARLPYSVGLVAAGVALAFVPNAPHLALTPELIFTVLLPPLVFEAALQLDWAPFKRELPVTLVLAFFGVIIGAGVVTAAMHLLAGWSLIGAALFGVLVAATDPVSVIAAFREMKVGGRPALLIEAESLLNDGVAAVLFALLVGIVAGGRPDPSAMLGALVWTGGGGVLVGIGVAAGLLFVAGRTEDHLVEITLTTIIAYGAFLLAEHVGMSGVLASLSAGLLVGNRGWRQISEEGRGHVEAFWTYAAFLANSVVFILIGAEEAQQTIIPYLPMIGIAVAAALVARAAAVYPLAALFARTTLRLPAAIQHMLIWGGLRGALTLALALAVPAAVHERAEIVIAAFAVVAFSVFVQGLTMPLLMRRLGIGGEGPHA